MKPLTPSEAADLARVCQHPAFESLAAPDLLTKAWRFYFWTHPAPGTLTRHTISHVKGTLRACLRAAVRWIEEQGT